MSCEICRRSSCTRSFHSLESQNRHDEIINLSEHNTTIDLAEMVYDLQEQVKQLELESEGEA